MPVSTSRFSQSLEPEAAFLVLARAREHRAAGKDIVGLEIGDSPFETPPAARAAGIAGIEQHQTHYCPSPGLPELRTAAARFVAEEFSIPATADNIVIGPGAKIFEQLFCEAFLNPGDGVLVFSPHFPTYPANIHRRQARMVLAPLRADNQFRPDLKQVEHFLETDPAPRAIFLNSPHNPTGGVATEEDLRRLADLVRGRDIAVFSDEPYCHMVWQGQHRSLLAHDGMLDHAVAAYTFSKSYSMSGWRLGFSVSSAKIADVLGQLINTTLSCTPPIVQLAGLAALQHDREQRDRTMQHFRSKVMQLSQGLREIDELTVPEPLATFYVFADATRVCNRLGVTSHGLATWLLDEADPTFGIACLGGECFGAAGHGFLRFSCAEPNDRLAAAVQFLREALDRTKSLDDFTRRNPAFRLRADSPGD